MQSHCGRHQRDERGWAIALLSRVVRRGRQQKTALTPARAVVSFLFGDVWAVARLARQDMDAPPPTMTQVSPTIRPMCEADVDAVARLWYSTYWDQVGWEHLDPSFLAERNLDSFFSRARERVADTLLATHADDIVGMCVLHPNEVEQFFLSRMARGTGVSSKLMAAAEREHRRRGCTRIHLVVFPENTRARRFYERCGWTSAGDVTYEAQISGGRTYALRLVRYEKPLVPSGVLSPAAEDRLRAQLATALPRDAAQPLVPVGGGLTNAAFRLGAAGPLCKLYGPGTARLTDRARERRLMGHLARVAAGTGKQLLATFDGGHVEEWLDGSTIPFDQMVAPHGDAIGRLLGTLHALPLPSSTAEGTRAAGDEAADETPAARRFWDDMVGWAAALPADASPAPAALLAEIGELRATVAASPDAIIHRDVHGANLVLPPAAAGAAAALRLIDWEFACVGPRAFDVANFFLECAFVEESGAWDWARVPDRAARTRFAAAYQAGWDARVGRDGPRSKGAPALVDEWDAGWGRCAHLWNILWAMTVAHGTGGGGAGGGGAEEAAAKRQRTAGVEPDAGGGEQPAITGAVTSPAVAEEAPFDYDAYARARWERYLMEKAAAAAPVA